MPVEMPLFLAAGGCVGLLIGIAVWLVADRPPSIEPRVLAVGGSSAAACVGLALGVPLMVATGPMISAAGVAEWGRRRRRAADRRRQTGLPVVLDAMIQQLRSGMGLRMVCADPASVGPDVDAVLRPLVESIAGNLALREAVAELQAEASRRGWHDAQLFATTLAALVDRGGEAVPALRRLRVQLMGSIEAQSRAGAQAAQAQASAALLAGAPALFALVVASADADVAHLYVREPLGAFCVAVAFVFSYGGWRWMSREVERALGRSKARDVGAGTSRRIGC